MSTIIFTDWENYTEDGVPKVLDWNALQTVPYTIPLTALFYAINERYVVYNAYYLTSYSMLMLDVLQPLLDVATIIQDHIGILSLRFVDRQVNLDNTIYLGLPIVKTGTPPSLGNKLLATALYGDFIKWVLEQREIIDNCTLLWFPNTQGFVNYTVSLGLINTTNYGYDGAATISAFNAATPVWSTGYFILDIKFSYRIALLPGGFQLKRRGFKIQTSTGLLLKCKKYIWGRHGPSVENGWGSDYLNTEDITELDNMGYWLQETTVSDLDAPLNTFDFHKNNTLPLPISQRTYGIGGQGVHLFIDLNVTGGFKFIPNIII